MIVSCHGVRGWRSLPQSKYGLVTTDFGMNGALSASFFESVRIVEASTGTPPRSTAPARRPLCRTDRAAAWPDCSDGPFCGSHGPCTRKP